MLFVKLYISYKSYFEGSGRMKQTKGKYAWTVKIGEKGQFVIPKAARDIFDIHPGDTIIVLADKKRGIAIPPKSMFTKLAETIFRDRTDSSSENGGEKG